MTILADFLEDKVLDHFFVLNQHTVAAGLYMSLHDGDPADTGANELGPGDDTGYTGAVRPAAAFSKLVNNSVDNDANISYTPTDGTNIITHIGIWDSATVGAGNCYAVGALDGSRTITSTAPITIAAGDLIIAVN
jgi:hypothetical protein